MTIEVANESGVGIDEIELVSVARFVLDRMRHQPARRAVDLLVDVDAMTELHRVDGPARPDRRDGLSDGRWRPGAGRDEGGNDRPIRPRRRPEASGALLGDVVLCPAVATDQAARPVTRSTTSCTC